ncbi:MAG: ChaN family lipoprotein [Pseudooceanicola sp.]|nr:ChaN family lipoprotein [Pseudooceanicola sp.]
MRWLVFALLALATGADAQNVSALQDADIVLLGEVHDNPGHHAAQAQAIAALGPTALVFEMLTPDQAKTVVPSLMADEAALSAALDWENSGWPDFALYFPLFQAAPDAAILGAGLPRDAARQALEGGVAKHFGSDAGHFGLADPLPPEEQAAREAEQAAAHCDALPDSLLPGMVDLQRLRDALLARAALEALDAHGGPVVVITGNGHARRDGGVPQVLEHVRPGVRVVSVGQDEGGRIDGVYDVVWEGPLVKRRDPCEAFRKN